MRSIVDGAPEAGELSLEEMDEVVGGLARARADEMDEEAAVQSLQAVAGIGELSLE